MKKAKVNVSPIKQNWHDAWHNKAFRWTLISVFIVLAIVIFFTYHFFNYIESSTGGEVLNDWILNMLPPKDVSIPIVSFEASVIILFFLRCINNPTMFITFLIGLIFIVVSRCITIDISQFRAPKGIIELKDPIAGMIYKTKFINRDLFYSGHVSILCLFYLCSSKKADKYYMLLATI